MVGDLNPGVETPMVGDEVLVRGTVLRWLPGVGAVIEVLGKTDVQQVWVRPDRIDKVILPDLPGEPADGTMLGGTDPDGSNDRVFRRDDAEGHNDRHERRHDRHWWDVVAEEWIDWPTAVRRGADPGRVLREITPLDVTQ
ncbi:hypothetical protein BDK92_7319 [Micromonospora pisi]|uniref:Uncharacterized protein n=1 Tax=Micromonospora pisi TaxID=589240 RepID=A0A495JUZ3_9ACTN|nr:hypothetical protein [Micromonospora pisi]RKR92837.1 hypothetical protein BDK92_7319 [Micromonospora pisi]